MSELTRNFVSAKHHISRGTKLSLHRPEAQFSTLKFTIFESITGHCCPDWRARAGCGRSAPGTAPGWARRDAPVCSSGSAWCSCALAAPTCAPAAPSASSATAGCWRSTSVPWVLTRCCERMRSAPRMLSSREAAAALCSLLDWRARDSTPSPKC